MPLAWPVVRPLIAAISIVLCVAGCGSSAPATHTARLAPLHRSHHHRGQASALVTNATPQPDWKPYAGQGVPILVYHQLGDPPPASPYPALYTSDAAFVQEIGWLHAHGFEAVTLDEMMRAFFHHGTLPAKPVVITFDDGVIPQATFAPSVLSRYGWPGVLNEVVRDHLSNARLFHLHRIGWEIDSHSVTHPDMTTLTPAEVQFQLTASRAFFRHTIHVAANSFCYPASRYNAAIEAAVKAAGYTSATTENPGFATPSSDLFALPRFEMTGGLPTLEADLAGR